MAETLDWGTMLWVGCFYSPPMQSAKLVAFAPSALRKALIQLATGPLLIAFSAIRGFDNIWSSL